jgi:phage tail protein X
VHLACRKVYFETDEILEQVLHFSPALSDAEREELIRALDPEQTN